MPILTVGAITTYSLCQSNLVLLEFLEGSITPKLNSYIGLGMIVEVTCPVMSDNSVDSDSVCT